MARVLKRKELDNTKLATSYGGWMYCEKCGENIAYLCYSNYDSLELNYRCACGSDGRMFLDFEDSKVGKKSDDDFIIVKNRFCCPNDSKPLIKILDKKIVSYKMVITCKSCSSVYEKIK